MNPKSTDCGTPSLTKDPRRKRVFQRRLQSQLSESRMLEVLDRSLQHERPDSSGSGRQSIGLSNQEQEEQETNDEEEKEEEEQELVCVSKMVKLPEVEPVLVKSSDFQTGGVLKTVRYIHRQRAILSVQQENQAEH